LRELTDLFRAYVAAVKVTQQHKRLCSSVQSLPLSSGEKVSEHLPDFQPAELFITVAKRNLGNGWRLARHASVNGGVAVRGKALSAVPTTEQTTPVIAAMQNEVPAIITEAKWQRGQRQYVALRLDASEPPPKVPVTATSPVSAAR
jgi:hypothetical protein